MSIKISSGIVLIYVIVGLSVLGCSVNDNPKKGDDCVIFNYVYTNCECENTEEGCGEVISTKIEELTRLQNLLNSSGEECIYVEEIKGSSRTISGYIKAPLNTTCFNIDWDWNN